MMRIWRLSVWRLSVAYVWPKSTTERLGHHFQGQQVKGQGHQAALFVCSSQANMDMQFVTDPYACIMYIMSHLQGAGA